MRMIEATLLSTTEDANEVADDEATMEQWRERSEMPHK